MQPPPHRDQLRRVDNSLSVWVLEAKGVPPKRRFFCEISLDQVVRARTSAKAMADGICFWGEQFDFQQLPPSQLLCIDLFREAEPSKKRKSGKSSHEDLQNLIGLVRIPMSELSGRQPTEKWYPVSSGGDGQPTNSSNSTSDGQPSLRLKARYQSVHVLPLRAYGQLREFLRAHSLPLCAAFEPLLGVKAKEDFANALVRILHVERKAPEALAELAMAEVLSQENDHLLFRGNSLATKAVEAYMKCVASDYLQMALGEFVRQLLCSELSCEVDPLRLTNSSGSGPSSAQLEKNRQQLMRQVEMGWRRILACQEFFPYPLRLLFAGLRQRLEQAGRAELADNLLSSSIFLRFLCPAILSPSLFGLVGEYPTGQAARNLTLIAKSLQTLANFTRFGGKEAYMEFMNAFVEREWRNMHQFLSQISAPCPRHCQAGELQSKAIDAQFDLGKELSLLSSYLRESWTPQMQENHHKGQSGAMGQLWGVLVGISGWDHCDQDAGEELDGGDGQLDEEEEGEEDGSEGMNNACNGHNPPSDYENNGNAIGGSIGGPMMGHNGHNGQNGHNGMDDRRHHSQGQPLAHSQQILHPIPGRRAILPPQPTAATASALSMMMPSQGNPPLPLAPPPANFSPSAAAHLHSSDDYVLSSALAKLRAASQQNEGGGGRLKSTIHLYDETPVPAASAVHLYDEVAGFGSSNEGAGGSRTAMASGVVTAQRGVACHEAQRRELCTPRMVQRGMRQQGMTIGADEADDESESDGRGDAHGDEGENGGILTGERKSAQQGAIFRQALAHQQRRPPRKRSGQIGGNNGGQQKLRNGIDGSNAGNALGNANGNALGNAGGNAGVHFDSSSASAQSQNYQNHQQRRIVGKTTTSMGGQMPIPSSGYQSQLNSSGSSSSSYSSSAASSNSASPIDAISQHPLGHSAVGNCQQNLAQQNNGVFKMPSSAHSSTTAPNPPTTIPPSNAGSIPPNVVPMGHHQTTASVSSHSSGSSSSSSSSAYSSLSPSNQPPQIQQQNGTQAPQFPQFVAKPPRSSTVVPSDSQHHQQIGQHWPSPRERAQTAGGGGGGGLNGGIGGFNALNGSAAFSRGSNEQQQQQRPATAGNCWSASYQQQQTPKTRMNPSCWSIPGSSGANANGGGCSSSVPPRQALVGSTPGDPLGAFIRYPATSASHSAANAAATPLPPQKFPTAAELQHHQWPGREPNSKANGGPVGLYASASVDLGIGIGAGGGSHRREPGQTHSMVMGQSMAALGDFELIETQRRQIAELTRENAALRRELDTVRAVSHSSLLPAGQNAAKYPNESI